MKLYILRHGDAVVNPALPDTDRPLSDPGHQQARAAGTFLKSCSHAIDLVLCSPLLRAFQTAEGVLQAYGSLPIVSSEYLVPDSNQQQLFDQLNTQTAWNILLIGHEPHLSATISLLLSGESRARVEMKKASLACIEIATPIQKGRGTLQWLLTFDHMRRVK